MNGKPARVASQDHKGHKLRQITYEEGSGDNVVREIVERPVWQRVIWKLAIGVVGGAIALGSMILTAVFALGSEYQKYQDLQTKMTGVETRLAAVEATLTSIPGASIDASLPSLAELATRVEAIEGKYSASESSAEAGGSGSHVLARGRTVDAYAIMLNEAAARKGRSGGFYLQYMLDEHICDVNRMSWVVESGGWKPNAGDILKIVDNTKNLESWCMVVGLYTAKKDSDDARGVFINVSRPVAKDLAFRDPTDKVMAKVTVSLVADIELTNDQRNLRAKYKL